MYNIVCCLKHGSLLAGHTLFLLFSFALIADGRGASDAVTPVQVISSEVIQEQGSPSRLVSELATRVPGVSVSGNGDQFNLRTGVVLSDGTRIYPPGGSVSLRGLGVQRNFPTEGTDTYTGTVPVNLTPVIPSNVDLQQIVVVRDAFGRESFRGAVGNTFTKPDDGVDNADRPQVELNLNTPDLNFTNGRAELQFNLLVRNGTLSRYGNGIVPRGVGVTDDEDATLVSSTATTQTWEKTLVFYRNDADELVRDLFIDTTLEDGTLFSLPLSLNLSGDAVVDTTAPSLLDSRWRTLAQNPTFLNLYPHQGRNAFDSIYVQADMDENTDLRSVNTFFYLKGLPLVERGRTPFGFGNLIADNSTSGTWGSEVYMPNEIDWSKIGPTTTFPLEMFAEDIFGNSTTRSLGDVGFYGVRPGRLTPDLTFPGLPTELIINNGLNLSIPLDATAYEVPASVRATDEITGVDFMSLTYQGPSGLDAVYLSFNRVHLSQGTLQDGLFSGKLTTGVFFEEGEYHLTDGYINDRYGNQTLLDLDTLSSSVQSSFFLTNPNADVSFPQLGEGGVKISDTAPDVTMNPVDISFDFTLTDVGMGLSYGSLDVFHSTNRNVLWKSAYFSVADRTGGDQFSASFSLTIPFETTDEPGMYYYQLTAVDMAGRNKRWGQVIPGFTADADPLPEGSDMGLDVSSNGGSTSDTSPPMLDSISITPGSDLKDGASELDVTLGVSDDVSELLTSSGFFGGFSYISLLSPTGAKEIKYSLKETDLTSGDLLSGVYNFKLPLSQGLEPGPYSVQVGLTNSVNLFSSYGLRSSDMEFPNDFSGYIDIENTGPVDLSPPVPTTLSVDPAVVTEGSEVSLKALLEIEDLGSGFESGTLSLHNGTNELYGFRNQIWSTSLVPPEQGGEGTGDKYNSNFEFNIDLLPGQYSGDFLSLQVRLTDAFGNTAEFDSGIYNYSWGPKPLPFDRTQINIITLVDEDDYQTFADKEGTFPAEATMEQKGINFDYDYDGRTNGQEFIEGTRLTDPNDRLRTWISYEKDVGTTVQFSPFYSDRIYTLNKNLNTDTEDPEKLSKVPLLGDLPTIGKFFLSKEEAPDPKLLVFMTVQLVDSNDGD